MSTKKVIFDLDMDKCVACGACAIACMDQNDIKPDEGEKPFRTVGNAEPVAIGDKIRFLSSGCMHCEDAACIAACPSNVFRKNELGLTVYDNTNCIGCHSCLLACPYGAPTFWPSGKMEKCNGCAVRLEYGLEPACVNICPTGALTCRTVEEYEQMEKGHSLKQEMRS